MQKHIPGINLYDTDLNLFVKEKGCLVLPTRSLQYRKSAAGKLPSQGMDP